MASNYDVVIENWRSQFLTWNHRAQMANLGYTTLDDNFIHLTYLKTPYRIDRATGWIENLNNPEEKLEFSTIMALYHILYYPKANPKTSGNWVAFRDVRRMGGFEQAFQQQFLAPVVAQLGGKVAELKALAQKIGFPLLPHGDVSFLAELFPGLCLKVIFWDGDEEFPPQLSILFDENIIDFTHEETVIMMAGDLLRLLAINL